MLTSIAKISSSSNNINSFIRICCNKRFFRGICSNTISSKVRHAKRNVSDTKRKKKKSSSNVLKDKEIESKSDISELHHNKMKYSATVQQYVLESATPRSEEQQYNVFEYMTNLQHEKARRSFQSLQPSSIKPYGSTENAHSFQSLITPRKLRIQYPPEPEESINDIPPSGVAGDRRLDSTSRRNFSVLHFDNKCQADHEEADTNLKTAELEKSKNKEQSVPYISFTEKLQQVNKTKMTVNILPKPKPVRIHVYTSKPHQGVLAKIDKMNKTSGKRYFSSFTKRLEPDECRPRVSDKDCLGNDCDQSIRADFNLVAVPKHLPKLDISKCPCVEPEIPTQIPKIRRLKLNFADPPNKNVCPLPPKCVRADDGMQFGPKKLPIYMPGECKCVASEPLKNVPLVRLKPNRVEEPKRDVSKCLPPPCPPRADFNLKVQPQKLPNMPAGSCPCVEPHVPNKNHSVRRLNLKFQDKPRICSVDKCPPRADDSLKLKEKRLPVIKAGPCECVEMIPPVDVPLVRLQAKLIEEPKRLLTPCLPPPCPPRADEGMKLEKKKLPAMTNSDCPCVEDYVPSVNPKVKRLNLSIWEPKRVCPPEPPCIRADDGMVIKQKNLAPFHPGSCKCIENPPMVDVPLARLKPKDVLEPKRSRDKCEPPPCPPRADEKLKVKLKPLPMVPKGNCPCIEPEIPTESPSLRRLVLKVPEPVRVCPISTCGPRSDELLRPKKKSLPLFVPGDCKCIEPTPLEDVPLVRLKPKQVEPPPRSMKSCQPPPCPPRSDENLKVTKKKLPKIEIGSCPCIEEYVPDKNPKLHRLKKVFMDRDNTCPLPPKCVRADDTLVHQPKRLPKFAPGDCVCVETEPLTDVPLARLKPMITEEPNRDLTKCLPPPCPPRADDNMKLNPKHLPLLKVGLCPCVEPEVPSKMPAFRKLNLKVEERPLACPIPFQCPPRADDSLEIKQKQLPVYKPGHCECIEPTPLVEVPLKRLKKKCDDDHPKYQNCDTYPRADKGCWEYPPKKLLKHYKDSEKSSKRKYCTNAFKSEKASDKYNLHNKGIEQSKSCQIPSSSRPMSSVSVYKKNKNKKNILQDLHAITCKKRCPVFLYKKCPPKTVRVCHQSHLVVCCEKKNSPYPAFSEIMRTSIQPFTKQTQWRCESVRYGFDPKVRANKRTYSTNMGANTILSKKFSVVITPKCALHNNINTKSTNKCRKKSCPKFVLDNCPPKVPRAPKCNESQIPYGNCRKQTAPYPSFTDCLDQEFEEQLMECPMERERYLLMQPKSAKAITLNKTILKLPPPHQGKIDPHKEEHCIREKLKKPNTGLTQTCADFGEPYIPMRARDLIKTPKNPKCPDLKQKGIRRYSSMSTLPLPLTSNYNFSCVIGRTSNLYLHSLQSKSPFLDLFNNKCNDNLKSDRTQKKKISTIISRRPCYVSRKSLISRNMAKKTKRLTLCDCKENEEKPKKNPDPKKPPVSKISPCRIKEDFIEEKEPSCPKPVKSSSETAINESKPCSKECPKFPYNLSECKREFPRASAEKKSSVCVSATSQGQATTLWQKIVKYFQAREGCPTAEELLQQRLLVKAEKAAQAAGMCLCDPKQLQHIKSSCERKQSQQMFSGSRRCFTSTVRSYTTKKEDENILTDEDEKNKLFRLSQHLKRGIEILENEGSTIGPDDSNYGCYSQLKTLTTEELKTVITHQRREVMIEKRSPKDNKEHIVFSCKFAQPSKSTHVKTLTNSELSGVFQDFCNKIESSNGESEKKLLNEFNLLFSM